MDFTLNDDQRMLQDAVLRLVEREYRFEQRRGYAAEPDGFSLGVSNDNAVTFQPVMKFPQLLGPLTCAAVKTNCEPHWERIQGVLGIGSRDAGQGSSKSGGSHCASAGADVWSWCVLAALLSRQRRARRR